MGGLKAVAAAKAASAAAKQAAAQAIAMAQNTNLAALQAEQAQANLEKYVYGVPVSSVPPAIAPMPPAAMHPYPTVQRRIPVAALLATALLSQRGLQLLDWMPWNRKAADERADDSEEECVENASATRPAAPVTRQHLCDKQPPA